MEKQKRILQSRDLRDRVEPLEPETVEFGGTLKTGSEFKPTPGQWLEQHATAEELAAFRATVEKRLKKDKGSWRKLPDGHSIPGEWVLTVCSSCGKFLWIEPGRESGPCLTCNWQLLKGGGMRRRATKAEEKAWFDREKKATERWKAEAPRRAKETAAFNRRMMQDRGEY